MHIFVVPGESSALFHPLSWRYNGAVSLLVRRADSLSINHSKAMKIKKLRKLLIKAERAGGCEKLSDCWNVMQTHLIQSAASNRPSPNNGILKFLVDSASINNGRFNLESIVSDLDQEDGKQHQVNISFMPRQPEQTELGDDSNLCELGDELKYKTEVKYLRFRHISKKLTISQKYLRCIKEGNDEYRTEAVAQLLRTYLDSFGKAVAEEFMKGGYVGKFARSGATCKPLYLYDSTGRAVNQQGDIQLAEDMLNADMSMMPTLIGSTKLSAYEIARQIASANFAGFDITKLGQELTTYRDTTVASVGVNGGPVVADRVIAVIPGAVKLVTTTDNSGEFEFERETQLRGRIQDPFYGLWHDYYINESLCDQKGVKTTIQFAINWDIIGYPSCWADLDPEFKGVTDVFCYEIQCGDAGVCSMETTTTNPFTPTENVERCNGYEQCEKTCVAQFQNECAEFALFRGVDLASGLVSAVRINGAVDISLGGQYNIASNADGLVAALQTALASMASIKVVGGGFDGLLLQLDIVAATSITSIELINDSGDDIQLTRTVQYLQHVWDVSTPSTGATISALNWTAPDTTTFGGAPTDGLIAVAGHYGTMQNFFANVNESGAYILEMTDSNNCESNYSASLEPCAGLEFNMKWTVFNDENENDLQDVGETVLANVKIQVWKGITQTELADEQVSDGAGIVSFNLEAGTYNMTIDTTFGAAVGRTIGTTLPKYVTVSVAGVVTYGPQWSENAKIPVGPVA